MDNYRVLWGFFVCLFNLYWLSFPADDQPGGSMAQVPQRLDTHRAKVRAPPLT